MTTQKILAALALCLASTMSTQAEVEPKAQYNLHGQGGIRDTAAPAVWKSLAPDGPDLMRQGSPKVMSNGPESRRQEYDSSIKFEEPDQCYSVDRNLVHGDNFVVEVWAYALHGNDGGWHAVVANGDGRNGFIIGQNGDQWSVLVGGIGTASLGQVQPETWTHLAIVKSRGQTTGWLNGKKICSLPNVGGGAKNFSLGATAPGRESFRGWIAEVRYATFRPGKFDPAGDFLMDTQQLKTIQREEMAERAKMVESLLETPGAKEVARFDEQSTAADWLLQPPTTQAWVQVLPGPQNQSAQIMLGNGLISRTFLVSDNLGCISLRRSDKKMEFVRAVKPEVRFRVNGGDWVEVGGLTGALDKSFLTRQWYDLLESNPTAFRFTGMTIGPTVKPYEWQPKWNAPTDIPWPAKGVRVTFHFAPPPGAVAPLNDLLVDVHYEIYDGLPALMKTFTVQNRSGHEMVVNEINGEYLAVQQDKVPLLHCESDYSFAEANLSPSSSGLGIHLRGDDKDPYFDYHMGGGTTKWEGDPDWGSMATLNPAEDVFLKNPQLSLLVSKPSAGPGLAVEPGGKFEALRTFEILNDTDEKERYFLGQRRFYKKLAPQVNEHLIQFACPGPARRLKAAIDQISQVGFDKLFIDSGITYEDISERNIDWLKDVCDYAKTKGICVGGYELMMASRGRGAENDCIDPATMKPGSMFGQSTCGGSQWGQTFSSNIWVLVAATGLDSFDPDGPYHGDPCASTTHPGHRGLEDSQWTQWRFMCNILHEGQKRGLSLPAPDWYFLNGQSSTGMGYREATDTLNIVLQTVLYRQYIYDGTYCKTAGMGWVNLNTSVIRGGLEDNLDTYERDIFGLLSSGAEVIVRQHLYDGPRSKAMLMKWVNWYHKYKNIIQGDIIHLRRPDGRSLDYYLHVNPDNLEKGMLLVFNPTPEAVSQTLDIPLYYTGLTKTAQIREQEGEAKTYRLDRDFSVKLPVHIAANGYTWLLIQ
jgi:hypothetical protein